MTPTQTSPPTKTSAGFRKEGKKTWNCMLRSKRRPPKAFLFPHSYPFSSSHGGRRPKKRVYHRVPSLDQAMDLAKKPSLLLRLRHLILASPSRSLLLRDLEKHVGFAQKWTFLSLIERHPTIFHASGGKPPSPSPISVTLTDKALKASSLEALARKQMEPILVKSIKKLLMLSMDCHLPLEKIALVAPDLGLPEDFERDFIPRFPEAFKVRSLGGRTYLCLESWDSSLAVTAREERLDLSDNWSAAVFRDLSRDGNYAWPFAFHLSYAEGFRPNTEYLKEVRRWQRMAFPSPYLNSRRVEPRTPQARKRAVAVLHEILSLMMEKRLTSDKLDAFHNEYQLPCRLLLCLVKNHGMFYITNKGARSTVFLKEAYDGSYLLERCPLLRFRDQFVSLSGRTHPESCNAIAA